MCSVGTIISSECSAQISSERASDYSSSSKEEHLHNRGEMGYHDAIPHGLRRQQKNVREKKKESTKKKAPSVGLEKKKKKCAIK